MIFVLEKEVDLSALTRQIRTLYQNASTALDSSSLAVEGVSDTEQGVIQAIIDAHNVPEVAGSTVRVVPPAGATALDCTVSINGALIGSAVVEVTGGIAEVELRAPAGTYKLTFSHEQRFVAEVTIS